HRPEPTATQIAEGDGFEDVARIEFDSIASRIRILSAGDDTTEREWLGPGDVQLSGALNQTDFLVQDADGNEMAIVGADTLIYSNGLVLTSGAGFTADSSGTVITAAVAPDISFAVILTRRLLP
ncbi:hypothetical protein, partial [Microbacterium sp.]|uniref:hypothetical protein n=1 Tax=Microbacterium sp. TaxID=51671 RepID=UPI00273736EA